MIALWFIVLHMLGDYVTQTNAMAAKKLTDATVRFEHVAIYTLPFAIFIALTSPIHLNASPAFAPIAMVTLATLAVFVPHFAIDCRRWASPDPWPPKPIMVDQTLHAIHLAIVGTLFYGLH